MVGVRDSFMAWNSENLTELLGELYSRAANLARYDEENRAWQEIEKPKGWHDRTEVLYELFKRRTIVYPRLDKELDDANAKFDVRPKPKRPRSPHCDIKESGFGWNEKGAFASTEANGTHSSELYLKEGDVLWSNADASAKRILEITRDYPGWRCIHCEGTAKSMFFRFCGGWKR